MAWVAALATSAACTPLAPSASPAQAAAPAAEAASAARMADFDRFCAFVADRYAYFDRKRTDWSATCADARTDAANAPNRNAFVLVVERTLDALYDFHAHVGTSNAGSRRVVPTDADVHAVWRDGRAVIVDVRARSAAGDAGARAGTEVVAIDGVAVDEAVAARLPARMTAPDPAARDWALDAVLAGRQDGRPVVVDVRDASRTTTLRFVPGRRRPDEAVTARCDGGVGIVAFNNSLGNVATIAAYDTALASLPCRRALVLDLRDTPSGGIATVARGIIGRLVSAPAPFQRHELRSEFRETGVRRMWVEFVEPRAPIPNRAVVVLVGHWTGSVGEALAIGLDAARGAPVLGRRMAGLVGALDELRLPNADFAVRVPSERLSHVNGTPREDFVPCRIPGDPGDEEAQLAYAVRVAPTAVIHRPPRSTPAAQACPRLARR